MLAQQDSDGISLLAGGDPDAHLVVGALALEQLWDDECLDRLKRSGIAKEIGNADQQVTIQRTDLIRLLLQQRAVVLEFWGLDHLHAALDSALKTPVLVFAEIVSGAPAQQRVDLGQRVALRFGIERTPIAHIADEPLRN